MFEVIRQLALTAGVVSLAVLLAIACDFAVGWRKAKERGEERTSYAMSRTCTKLVTYYSSLGVGFAIDVLLNVGRLWDIIGAEPLQHVPACMVVIAIFLCIVEVISIQESAETKLR